MNYSKKISGYLLAAFMVFGVAAVANSTVQAQYPWGYGQDRRDRDDRYRRNRNDDRDYRNDRYGNDRYGRNNGYNNSYQIARERGFQAGISTGASDAQRGQSYSPQRSHYWRNGNDGSSYGNQGQYRQVFRDAFVQGYRQGFQQFGGYNRRGNNGRWGNNGRLGNIWPY